MENPYPVGSVNYTVFRALHNYPSLFENRTQVLYSMFIAYGTGFYWTDGRLVDMYDEGLDKPDEEVTLAMPDSLKRKSGHPAMDAHVDAEIARWDADNEKRLAIRRSSAELALTPGPLKLRILGPTPAYAPYGSVPADVRSDWAEACAEILAVIEPLWAAGKHLEDPQAETKAKAPKLSPEAAAKLKELWAAALKD